MPLRTVLVAVTVLVTAAVARAEPPAAGSTSAAASPPQPSDIPDVEAVFVVPRFGEFRVRFFPDEVPNHVAQFLTLVGSGYYDGMSFHRVIPGYLIQTGDPASRDEDLNNDGAGGPPYSIPAEPTDRTHLRGTVSMAWRDDDPASAASQFFIALADLPDLDGHATPIGEVIEGMDTVDSISQVTTLRNRNPLDRVIIESARLVVPGGDETAAADADGDSPDPQ